MTEFRIRKETGDYTWVESVMVDLFGVEGANGIVVTTRPINERKQIEETLQKSESDLRRAEEIGRFGSWEVRLDENRVNASEGARSLYGLMGSHLTLEEIQQIPLPEYRPVLDAALRDLIAGKSPYNIEFKIWNPSNGTVLDIHSIAEYDRERNIVFGVFHDITERKQAEEKLQKQKAELNAANEQIRAAKEELHRQYDALVKSENTIRGSEEKFRYLVEYALDGILIVDVQGIIRFANNAAAHLTETDDCTTLVGRNMMEFIAPESRLDVTRDSVQIFEGNNGYLAHYNMISAKGKKINVEGIGRSVIYEGKAADLIALRDVTERRLAEEALRDANSKLALVTNITRHDINNQLLALNAYVELLHEKMPDSSFENYFSGIKQASGRISSMIQFTKKYNTAGESTPQWQNIRRLVDAAANQVNLRTIPEVNDLPVVTEIYADPLIVKVFYNLMENAVRYGGKITVIRFFIEENDDGSPIVVCEDDGDGIPAEDKERIFDWGFGKNTGLGLALSREILGITGIKIRETGVPGKGARFEMAVPGSSFRNNQ